MKRYRDVGGDRRIAAFESGGDYIEVMFVGGVVRRYTYSSAGDLNVEKMKWLAVTGDGLAAFIERNIGTP